MAAGGSEILIPLMLGAGGSLAGNYIGGKQGAVIGGLAGGLGGSLLTPSISSILGMNPVSNASASLSPAVESAVGTELGSTLPSQVSLKPPPIVSGVDKFKATLPTLTEPAINKPTNDQLLKGITYGLLGASSFAGDDRSQRLGIAPAYYGAQPSVATPNLANIMALYRTPQFTPLLGVR